MKKLYFNLTKITLSISILMFASCTTIPGSWKNDRISSGQRDDFHQLNNQALAAIKANDHNGIKMVFSKEMNAANNERLLNLISTRLNENNYELKDEFYAVHKYRDTDTIRSVGADVNRYDVFYPFTTPEMYFAFFIPKKADNKYMLTLAYSKFDYGWKIAKLELSPYTVNGKTAPELYQLAKDQYNKKYIQAALNNVSLALVCFEPNSYMRYPDEIDARSFYKSVKEEVKYTYKYPLILKQVPSGPMILQVYNNQSDDGNYPVIYYMTHYDLRDTNAVKKENMLIRKAVGKLMPGLNENNKFICYSAFNKQPTGYATVKHFDMTVKAN